MYFHRKYRVPPVIQVSRVTAPGQGNTSTVSQVTQCLTVSVLVRSHETRTSCVLTNVSHLFHFSAFLFFTVIETVFFPKMVTRILQTKTPNKQLKYIEIQFWVEESLRDKLIFFYFKINSALLLQNIHPKWLGEREISSFDLFPSQKYFCLFVLSWVC